MIQGLFLDADTVFGIAAGAADEQAVEQENTEVIIRRNSPAADAPERPRAFYDRARGIYFRSQMTRAARPTSII